MHLGPIIYQGCTESPFQPEIIIQTLLLCIHKLSTDIYFVTSASNSHIPENDLIHNWIKPDVLIIHDVLLYPYTTEACYAFITSGIYHKNLIQTEFYFWKEFEITGKKNRKYGELMREMSSVRCET